MLPVTEIVRWVRHLFGQCKRAPFDSARFAAVLAILELNVLGGIQNGELIKNQGVVI